MIKLRVACSGVSLIFSNPLEKKILLTSLYSTITNMHTALLECGVIFILVRRAYDLLVSGWNNFKNPWRFWGREMGYLLPLAILYFTLY